MPVTKKTLTFDRATVRRVDQDGRLHVEITNISKANVCPYYGDEIPGFEQLGLDPQRVYQLLRDPEELRKAAGTFNNIPLLSRHVGVHAEDPHPEDVIGSTGTDAEFVSPYLRNSLVVWVADAIKRIENDAQREISCSYWYEPDMTPGSHGGVHYDGVIRNIRGNHVALVEEGRAGPDVLVNDSQLKVKNMALSKKAALVKGAILAYRPKLAADAALDLNSILSGVTNKNFANKKAGIVSAIKSKLASDADVDGLVKLIDALEPEDMPEGADEEVAPPPPEGERKDKDLPLGDEEGDDEDELLDKLQALLDRLDKRKAAKDAPPPGKPDDPGCDEDKDDKVDKAAMDAALAAHGKKVETDTIARLRAIATAEDDVRPHVGKLAGAFDSAEAVYSAALRNMGVDITGITGVPALKALTHAHGSKKTERRATVAMDSSAIIEFHKAFPDAARIRIL